MPRANMSLPHERRKAKLQSRRLTLRVRLAEAREQLRNVDAELKAMKPKTRPQE